MALVQFVYFSVKAATAPHFSALFADDDRNALAKFSGQSVRWVFWPSLVVGLMALALGNILLGMFGDGFTAGYNVMVILFLGIMCKASVGPGEVLLTMAGEQSLCVKLYCVALAANIGLNLILIPPFGIQGAATAAALAMLVEAILLHVAVRRRLKITLFAFARPAPVQPIPEDA